MVLLGDKVKWKPDSVCLEIVLILMLDRCKVCVECTIGSKMLLDTSDRNLDDGVKWNLILVHLEIALVTVQDRCMVCAKRTIGS
jgi:hypothetical protein